MNILITGGTGLIGTELTRQLLQKGHSVAFLSRTPGKNELGVKEFAWDVDLATYDKEAFENIDTIINLAGATLNKRWTPQYKNEILRSRVDGTRLLYYAVLRENVNLKTLLSASAIGYYPSDYNVMFSENDAPGQDFLSMVTQKWEQEAQNFKKLNIRTIRARFGLVLSNEGGALPSLTRPIKYGVGTALGNGRQWLSWIHIHDAAAILIHLLENDLKGVYNIVAPGPVTNKGLNEIIASKLHEPLWLPKVPEKLLKLVLGEMATIVLKSNKVSNYKVESTGYKYKFSKLREALDDLLKTAEMTF